MPQQILASAGGPDRSIAKTTKTNAAQGLRKAGDFAVGCYPGEGQAQVAGPDRVKIAGHDAEVMLLSRRKRQSGEGCASQPIEAGVGSHPNATLAIDQHLPDCIGAEPLCGSEAFTRSRVGYSGYRPLIHVVKASQALIAHCPDGVAGEGKVARANAPARTFGRRALSDGRTRLIGQAAKSMIVGKPDGTIRGLMEKKCVVRGRCHHEGGRRCARIVLNALKFRLTQRHREQNARQRSYPNRSFTIYQNGRREASRVSVFRTDLLADRPVYTKQTTRRLQP